MHIYLSIILSLFFMLSPQESWAEKKYRIIVFGDGIISGYQLQSQEAFPAKLEQRLRAAGYDHLEVISLGNDNLSSANAIAETERVVEKLPDVIIIQLGYNDTVRGVLPSAINYSLNTIISDLKKTRAYIILVGTPAANNSDENYAHNIETNFYTLASTHNVPLYPSALEGIINNTELTMADGKHPNAAGVEVMVNGLLPFVDTGLRWRYEIYQQDLEQMKKEQGITDLPPP